MNFNCIIMVLHITHCHAEDPLDQFNWKNASISYQRDWMRYVQKLLEIILKTQKVMPSYFIVYKSEKYYLMNNINNNYESQDIYNVNQWHIKDFPDRSAISLRWRHQHIFRPFLLPFDSIM